MAIEGGPCVGKTTFVESIVDSTHTARRPEVLLEGVAIKRINALAEQGINFADIIEGDSRLFLQIEHNILADTDELLDFKNGYFRSKWGDKSELYVDNRFKGHPEIFELLANSPKGQLFFAKHEFTSDF